MKFQLVILLAVACQAYTPITEQSWVKFHKVKDPTYETIPLHGEPDIIHAMHILIEERISTLSTMVQKSICDFQGPNEKVHRRHYRMHQMSYNDHSRLWIC